MSDTSTANKIEEICVASKGISLKAALNLIRIEGRECFLAVLKTGTKDLSHQIIGFDEQRVLLKAHRNKQS